MTRSEIWHTYGRMGKFCPICGQEMDFGKSNKNNAATQDHIYPKCAQANRTCIQFVCRRCNSLKADLAPSILLYKCIALGRELEDTLPNIKCKNIEIGGDDEPIYKLNFGKYFDLRIASLTGMITLHTSEDKRYRLRSDHINTIIETSYKCIFGNVYQLSNRIST